MSEAAAEVAAQLEVGSEAAHLAAAPAPGIATATRVAHRTHGCCNTQEKANVKENKKDKKAERVSAGAGDRGSNSCMSAAGIMAERCYDAGACC